MKRIDLLHAVSCAWDESDSPTRLRRSLSVLNAIRNVTTDEVDRAAIDRITEYVSILIAAKLARLDGRIATAMRFEAWLDEIYGSLPPEWQW